MKKFLVVCIALAMVFAFTAEAMADMSAYGSIRFRTYSVDTDKDYTASTTSAGAAFDTRNTTWGMGLLSRIGFDFKSGDVGGKWEFDTGNVGQVNASSDSNRWGDFRVRHAYGYWNFGAGQLLIGQTWPLTDLAAGTIYYTGSLDQAFGGLGYITARPMQMRLTFGSFKVAFISPNTVASGVYGGAVDVTLPKIELAYNLKLENIAMDFAAGYQTYEERIVATDQTEDVEAYLLAFRIKANFGAFFTNLVAGYAQNPLQYGLKYTDNLPMNPYWANGGMHDVEAMNASLALGYKISDTVTLQGGYMYLDGENDSIGTKKYEDTNKAYFVNCKVKLADNVFVIPEIIVNDRDETQNGSATKVQQGKQTTAGIFWVINFK